MNENLNPDLPLEALTTEQLERLLGESLHATLSMGYAMLLMAKRANRCARSFRALGRELEKLKCA